MICMINEESSAHNMLFGKLLKSSGIMLKKGGQNFGLPSQPYLLISEKQINFRRKL